MSIFSREKVAKAAAELADHLQVIEHIKALQAAQKELANGIKAVNDRLSQLESEMRALKAEAKFECIKETQSIIYAVQGGLNQRLETLSNKMAVMEASQSNVVAGLQEPFAYKHLELPNETKSRKKKNSESVRRRGVPAGAGRDATLK